MIFQLSFAFLFVVILFSNCDSQESDSDKRDVIVDTIPPQAKIAGKIIDTAYLFSYYKDQGIELLDEIEGELRCPDYGCTVVITGFVNTEIPGTYFINYIGKDGAGNEAPVITRTVHVMQNTTSFLNGNYNVTSTCTIIAGGSSSPTLSIKNYTATVTSSSIRHSFELNWLNIGSEFAVTEVLLKNNTLEVHCPFLNGYDWRHSGFSGLLSSDRNSFVIETTCIKMDVQGGTKYKCKNVYTKQVIIK